MTNTHKELFEQQLKKQKYVARSRNSRDVWGPHFWYLVFTLTANFNSRDSKCVARTKEDVEGMLFRVCGLMPDAHCREILREYLVSHPLPPDWYTRDNDLFELMLRAHNHVQTCLGKPIGTQYSSLENALRFWKSYYEMKPNPAFFSEGGENGGKRNKALVLTPVPSIAEACKSDILVKRFCDADDITVVCGTAFTRANILKCLSLSVIDTWKKDLDGLVVFILADERHGGRVREERNSIPMGSTVCCDGELILKTEWKELLLGVNPHTSVSCLFHFGGAGNLIDLPMCFHGCKIVDSTSTHNKTHLGTITTLASSCTEHGRVNENTDIVTTLLNVLLTNHGRDPEWLMHDLETRNLKTSTVVSYVHPHLFTDADTNL